jgi:hypothetical protein
MSQTLENCLKTWHRRRQNIETQQMRQASHVSRLDKKVTTTKVGTPQQLKTNYCGPLMILDAKEHACSTCNNIPFSSQLCPLIS